VTNVTPGSEADDRGITAGDLIVSVDGKAVNSPEELVKIVNAHKPGDALLFRVISKDKSALSLESKSLRALNN
jgi:Trypsin-like serine proteases, typically periplasmic, contain C-terminal PDZ domain